MAPQWRARHVFIAPGGVCLAEHEAIALIKRLRGKDGKTGEESEEEETAPKQDKAREAG